MIDFRKRLSSSNRNKVSNPIELYETLDRKSITGPLRESQKYILNEWYKNRKDEGNLIVKLHTGEGKTLIGLLMLQSLINQEKGPSIYICPDKYLVRQVSQEADKFGIPYCLIDENNDIPDDYYTSDKILITHAHKLFNGRSIFGTGTSYTPAGAIVLDDSHACINVIRDAFTIKIDRNSKDLQNAYDKVLDLFSDDLREQGEGSFIEIQEEQSYETFMKVPYWAWEYKKKEVLSILTEFKDDNAIKFAWELIKDRMFECDCYISGQRIEIAPSNIRVDDFSTFSKAGRKILMSATTQDDIFFIKGLGYKVESVKKPITYPDMKWSGEKMILIPSLIHDDIYRDLIASYFGKKSSENFGTVVIVPSTNRANFYRDLGANLPNTNTQLINSIDCLKHGVYGHTLVLNNRYDGIDLPDESCRILILDSMPYLNDFADKYEKQCYPDSEITIKKLAQKIEQGLGRAVRGEKDYCAIIIIGRDLVRFIQRARLTNCFSPQTRKQIDIGQEIARMAKEGLSQDQENINPIISIINQMIIRDDGWKEYYTEEMNRIDVDGDAITNYDKYLKETEIEKYFSDREFHKASNEMQKFIDENIQNDLEKGWYLEKLARYTFPISKKRSIEIQASAFKNNNNLLKPMSGITYEKMSFIEENRVNNIKNYMNKFNDVAEFELQVQDLMQDLSFGMHPNKFENALQEVGKLLGYKSQRPDKETGKGPDNLWCGEGNRYLLFECKNQVAKSRSEITKKEAAQMNSHLAWFESCYGQDALVSSFMIVPTKDLAYQADLIQSVKIIRVDNLNELKDNIVSFIKDVCHIDWNTISLTTLQELLDIHDLNMESFVSLYSEDYYHKKLNE